MEMVISMAIMAILFAVLVPQLRAIQNSWDSKAGNAEILQNGRVLMDHLYRNLASAAQITAVSDSAETDGYIEFEDNDENILRYDIAANNYVKFGTVGSLNDLAGPVSQLLFTCYDGNEPATPITDGNDIRLVNVQATLTNPTAAGRDLTVGTSVCLRTDPLAVVDPNLILWLKLDEASGSTASDSSGNGNHGILENMNPNTDWVPGQIANALDFDGGNDYVDCGNDASLNITGAVTVTAWIKLADAGIDQKVAGNQDGIAGGYKMTVYSNNKVEFEIRDSGNNAVLNRNEPGGTVLTTDVWYHVAGVYFQGNYIRTYVNGDLDRPMSTASVLGSTSGDLILGRESFDTLYFFDGLLDDVRIYDRAMSGAEIGALYYIAGPVFQEFTEAKLNSDGTALTISTPGGASEGSLLIAAMATDGDTTSSLDPPAGEGWIQVFLNDQSGQVTIGVWWKLADASESASHEFTWSGAQQAYGWMMRVEGHDPADPIHDYSADGQTSASPSSPPVTTTQDKCLILRLGAFDDDYITPDDPGLSGHTAITMDASQSSGVSYEEFTEAKADSTTDELTISTPAGTAEGDLLIAAVSTDGDEKDDLAPPGGEGWTEIEIDDRGGRVTLGAWWKLAEASESPSHQFTWSSSQEAYGWMMRFTGHDPSDPIGDKGKLEGGSSTPDCPSVTTVAANSMILRIGGFDDDDINIDDPGLSGHTPITMDESSLGWGTCSGGAGYVLQASPGASGTSEFVLTGWEDYVCVTVAIEAAPPSGGGGSVSGGAGYVTQASSGSSGSSSFSLTASQEARTVTIAIAPVP